MNAAALALISALVCLASPAFAQDEMGSLQSRVEQSQNEIDLMDNLTPDEIAQIYGILDEDEVVAEPTVAMGQLNIRVSIASQRIYVDSQTESFEAVVSTGRKGYGTITGCFRPVRLHKMWYSQKYDNAPMPNSVFFHGGFAIHATNHTGALGSRASHGCVRVSLATSRRIYSLVQAHGRENTMICVQ